MNTHCGAPENERLLGPGLINSLWGYIPDMPASEQDSPVVVVTGASSGVGRATARRFAVDGASLVLVARGKEALQGTVDEVESVGATALAIAADVSDPEQIASAGDQAVSKFGSIDVWVNNAMTTVFSFFEEIEPAEYERATRVTYLGTVWGTRAALRHMRESDRGTIIQVGSALAYRGIPLQSPYCGAKHAIEGFTDSVRTELLHRGSNIHVGMVNLPAINTPQFSHCRSNMDRHPMPVPPIFQPEIAAKAIHLMFRKPRRHIDVAAPTVLTTLGQKLMPSVLDRYLAETGIQSQLDDREPGPHNEVGNLFDAVPGDPGAHGDFDDRARSFSPVFWLTENRRVVAGVTGVALAAAAVASRLGANN